MCGIGHLIYAHKIMIGIADVVIKVALPDGVAEIRGRYAPSDRPSHKRIADPFLARLYPSGKTA